MNSYNTNSNTIEETDSNTKEYINKYITVEINNTNFAINMNQVLEITRVPNTVEIPLSPKPLIGITNLRGILLPIIDLKQILNMPKTQPDKSTRVVVTDLGEPIGVMVDKVNKVISASQSRIKNVNNIQQTSQTNNIIGSIDLDNGQIIHILNIEQIITNNLTKIAHKTTIDKHTNSTLTTNIHKKEKKLDNTVQLITFSSGNEEFALNISQTKEIVRMPKQITQVPSSNKYIMGIFQLRNMIIPIISFKQLIGIPHKYNNTLESRVIIISTEDANNKYHIGLAVDQVKEVIRVDKSSLETIPSILNNKDKNCFYEAICSVQNGKRLISILNIQTLLNLSECVNYINNIKEELNMTSNSQNELTNKIQEEEQFAIFLLDDQEYGISISYIQEITRVPDKLIATPKTQDFLAGMINLRGKVLPIIDMRICFGKQQINRNERQRILVVEIDNIQVGFIIDSVTEILRINKRYIENINNTNMFANCNKPIVEKIANLVEAKRMIQIINLEAILEPKAKKAIKNL